MSGMLPPVLFELRSNATQFMGDMQAARASLAETGAAGDKTATDVQVATAKQEKAADRLARAQAVTADSIRADVDRIIAAEEELAEKTDTTYDAEARRAQLTANAVRSAAAEQVTAMRGVREADAEMAAASEKAAAKQETSAGKAGGAFKKFSTIASAAVVGAAVVVGVESLKMATDFQSKMTLLQTAGGETKANMKTVSDGIKNLAQSTGTSTDQLADGMYIVEKAGVRGANGLLVLKAAAEGAKAENVDLGTATNALTSIMMSYHLKASQATSTENMLVVAAGKAKTTMQNYAGALSTVIPIASAAHISFAQVGGAIATLTQHGTSAQEATQELASTIRNLQAPNNVAVKAMQQLGINVTDLETHLGTRGLTGTISLITDAISKKMGPSGLVVVSAFKKAQSATADLSIELGKMSPSLRSLSQGFESGKTSYADYYKGIKALGGAQYELGKGFIATMGQAKGFNDLLTSGTPAQQTAANALKKVMGGAIGLNTALMLGGPNMKYFTAATKAIGDAGKKSGKDISTWAATQKTLGVQMDKLKETVQVLFINIGTKLIPVVTKIVEWMNKHKTIVEILVGVLGGLAVILGTITAAMGALNIVMDANPVVLITVAIAALAVGMYEAYEHCKTFRDIVNDIGRALSTVWKDVLEPVVEFLKDDFVAQWHIAGDVISWFAGLPKTITKAWDAVVGWFEKLPGKIEGYLKDAGKWLLSTGKEIIGGLWTGIKDVAAGLYQWFVKVPGTILGYLKEAGKWLLGIGGDIIHGLFKGMTDFWNNEVQGWKDIGHTVVGWFKTAANWLYNVGEDIISGLWDGITGGFKWLKNQLTAMPMEIYHFFDELYDHMLAVGKNVVIGIWNGLVGMVGWLWNKVKSWLSDLWGGIESFFGINSPSTLARDRLGKNIVLGLAAGITENGHLAKNALTGLAADLAKTNMTAPGMKGVPFTNTPGSYGNTGTAGGGMTVVVNVAGSVLSENDLSQVIQQTVLRYGGVNPNNGLTYKRGGGVR